MNASVDIGPNIKAVIDQLASKLGVATDHLWQVLVRQMKIEAMQDGIWAMVFLIVAVVAARASHYGVHNWHNEQLDWNERDAASACLWLGGIIGFVAAGLCIAFICSAIGTWCNPEYYALQKLLGMLK